MNLGYEKETRMNIHSFLVKKISGPNGLPANFFRPGNVFGGYVQISGPRGLHHLGDHSGYHRHQQLRVHLFDNLVPLALFKDPQIIVVDTVGQSDALFIQIATMVV